MEYCITMELTGRRSARISAACSQEAVDAANRMFNRLLQDDTPFVPKDLEYSYALDEACGRTVVPWTDPVALENSRHNAGSMPGLPDDPDGGYIMTVEDRKRIAEWFDSANDEDAEKRAERILQEHLDDLARFDASDKELDYALDAPDGRTIVTWR